MSDDAPGWFSTFVGKYDQDTAETRDQIAQFGNEVGGLRTEVGDLRTGFGDLSSRVTALETGGGEALATRMLASTDVGEVLRQVIREDVTPQFASVHQRVDQVEATANEALATAKEARNLARAGGETNPFGVLAGAIIGAVVFGLFLWALADMTNVSDSNQYAMIILGVMAGALIGCNVGSSFRWPASNNETVAEAPTVEPAPARAVLPVRDPDAPPTEVVAVVR
ncbi:MAG TPA: hypothetical protein VLG27_01065 [Candidatus Saccharimonadia bacterium]|nr:hypothetical protein [Candidatus Saccharimonadia bacterium]